MSYEREPPPTEMVIEFATPQRPFEPPVVNDPVADVPDEPQGNQVTDSGDPTATVSAKPLAPVSRKSRAIHSLLAMDLSSLRSNVSVQDPLAEDTPIQTGGLGLAEPTIHLTDTQVDSLVALPEQGPARKGRKRGTVGRGRGPTVCLPPPH